MELKFDEKGLIPAIVQDHFTKEVLTLAYMPSGGSICCSSFPLLCAMRIRFCLLLALLCRFPV